MKVTKAIELLQDVAIKLKTHAEHDAYLAILLGIAGLKRHLERDYMAYSRFGEKLPGETDT